MVNPNNKVLMLVCNYCNPDNRVFRAANVLQENGFEVLLLAYHKEDLAEFETPDSGFQLRRIKTKSLFPFSGKINNLLRYWQFKQKTKKIAREYKPNFVHCHDYNTLFLGKYCKNRFDSNVIYDNHEYFQDLNYIHRYPLFIRKWIAKAERKALRSTVNELIVVSPGIAALYQPLFAKPIHIVRNIPDMNREKTESALPQDVLTFLEKQKNKNRKLLLYLGTNSQRGRGLDFTFSLLKILPDDFGLVIFGSKNESELNYLNSKYEAFENCDRFAAFQSLTHVQLKQAAPYCFMGLSLIEPIYLSYKHSLPNKLFEYLSMDLPVLSSDIPDQRKLVEEYNIGLAIPFQAEEAARLLKAYQPNRKAIEEAKRNLNWETESRIYLSVYHQQSVTL